MATKRRTREQWQRLVDKQAESELTVSEFCAQHALTVSNFYLWRKKLSDDREPFAQQDNWLALQRWYRASWACRRIVVTGLCLSINAAPS